MIVVLEVCHKTYKALGHNLVCSSGYVWREKEAHEWGKHHELVCHSFVMTIYGYNIVLVLVLQSMRMLASHMTWCFPKPEPICNKNNTKQKQKIK